MTPALRQASLSEDREELISMLEKHFPTFSMRTHFHWRHEGNPAGPGWSWMVYDRDTGTAGAMTSLFPRPMYVDGRKVLCGQVGEFVVNPAYRSLGPAMMLQRASFGPVDNGELEFCYDCPPHDKGMSTFIRLGIRPSCELTRYALLLKSDQVVEKRLGKGPWTKPVTGSINLLLKATRRHRKSTGLEIETLNGNFDEEFTSLDDTVPSANKVRSCRSAKILNWRYRECTDLDIEVLVARRGGAVVAFLACIIYPDRRACICDLFGHELSETGLALLDALVDLCTRRNVLCIEGYCPKESELEHLFKLSGFHARENAARVVAYTKSSEVSKILNSATAWTIGSAEFSIVPSAELHA